MIDEAKLAELIALADKATPGERFWDKDSEGDCNGMSVKTEPYQFAGYDHTFTDKSVISAYGMHTQGWVSIEDADAAFIAACDPGTIKALVEELEEKRFRLESLEK